MFPESIVRQRSEVEDLPVAVISRLRLSLLARIRRRYRALSEPIELRGLAGAVTYEFIRVEDPNRVLDEVAAEEDRRERVSGERIHGDQLHLPYWAELWDSARGMSQLLLKRYSMTPSLRVLDLGCGMGFTGMVAASLGHNVLFADMESPALLFAQLNTVRWAGRVRARKLNWQTTRLGEQFNLILGADILYERSQWPYLESFWKAHLSPDGALLLGEPGRQTGDDFPTWITRLGWSLTRHEEPVETRSRPIRLFEVRGG